jgi:4-hydroxythreonine-4-phosphate dehydrogenase
MTLTNLTSRAAPSTVPVAITQGDPAGIGPEIIIKSFLLAPELTRNCLVLGHLPAFLQALNALPDAHSLQFKTISHPGQVAGLPPRVIPLIELSENAQPIQLGQISAAAGQMAADAVIAAAGMALRNQVSAVVTAPLHKQALAMAGIPFPGHTELLQDLVARHLGVSVSSLPVRMMLANRQLRTVLVSIHVPLRRAIELISIEQIAETLRITHDSLSNSLGRPPKIAVAGLNPHAGESGLMGHEEIEFIIPAIERARQLGINAAGPFPPDTVYMRARTDDNHQGEFDVVVSMYHDQGLIPIKYLGLQEGVNVTLGLPLIRTSPDHGTALDLAGRGRADPASFIAALQIAQQMSAQKLEGLDRSDTIAS